jgi:hypothetical protein
MTAKAKKAKTLMQNSLKTAEQLVPIWNKASNDGDYKVMGETSKDIETAVNTYTANAKVYTFETIIEGSLKDKSLIIKRIAETLRYETIRIKEVKEGDLKIPQWQIDTTSKAIDPAEVEKYYGSTVGYDSEWKYSVEKFNMALCLRVALDIGMTEADVQKMHDSYAMNKLCEKSRAGMTPVSNTQLGSAMQVVIDKMLGAGVCKVTSHDVKFLLHSYAKKDNKKGLSITASTHKQLRMLFMDIVNNILAYNGKNSRYTIQYKEKSKKDTPTNNKEGFIPITDNK